MMSDQEVRMVRLRSVVALVALLLVMTACSDKNNNTVTPGAGGTTSPTGSSSQGGGGSFTNKGTLDGRALSETELEMDNEGSEFYFKPTFIRVDHGQKIKLELMNEGSAPHNFTASALNLNKTLDPDKREDVEVTIPASGGDIVFFCSFHASQGMRGALYFGDTPPATAASSSSGSGDTDNY
jgi:plastocyanin